MSNQKVETLLPDYGEPLFPEPLAELQQRLYVANGQGICTLNADLLDDAVAGIRGFIGNKRYGLSENRKPITADGYHWFWQLVFTYESGTIAILFPGAKDWTLLADGTMADRHIALYVSREGVNPAKIGPFVREIAAAILSRIVPPKS